MCTTVAKLCSYVYHVLFIFTQRIMAEARLDRELREAEAVESKQTKSKLVCHYHVERLYQDLCQIVECMT